ncbi:MAG: hypothetical protein IRY99_26500 [Isosphaeraceae bacterium]|nr:hypothetical protein [Isosphaeraceae bacterium]
MSEHELSLLNVYEVEDQGRTRYLVGFLDPVLAGSRGIALRAMIGEFTPRADGEFDLGTFEVNPEFIAAFEQYMNGEPSRSPAMVEQARAVPGQWLYLVDPRNTTPPDQDPPAADILGRFAVDDEGQVVPNSFQYNNGHLWFSPESGVSGLLLDKRFYNWLHQIP